MNEWCAGDYNYDQWISHQAIQQAFAKLPPETLEELKAQIQPYLQYRQELEVFQQDHFAPICRKGCFETALSACCGFESIITFFADQVINFLLSGPEQRQAIVEILQTPNTTGKCVYLGDHGCIWQLRPISCTMFVCEDAQKQAFAGDPEAASHWRHLQAREKVFTWPDKPVLFDAIEKMFLPLGVDSPHLYFHQSPGLLRLKSKAGLTT